MKQPHSATKKSPTTLLYVAAWTLFFSGKCSTPTLACLRHHRLLSIFSRNIEKLKHVQTHLPNNIQVQKTFPTMFSRHCVTDAFWMPGFSDPNGFREKTILLRYQDYSMCYFQEPNWNRKVQPPEVFFQESKAAPPEPFFRNRNRNRNCPSLSSITQTNRSTPKP